jgi:hypothetical protein
MMFSPNRRNPKFNPLAGDVLVNWPITFSVSWRHGRELEAIMTILPCVRDRATTQNPVKFSLKGWRKRVRNYHVKYMEP